MDAEKASILRLALAGDPALMMALQSRLSTLVGKSSGYVESLPEEVQERLSSLKEIQAEWNTLHEEKDKAIRKVEHKYEALAQPLWERRKEIIEQGIPEFWLTAIKGTSDVSEAVQEADEPALVHLQDIRSMPTDDWGFTLVFEFDSTNNPIFRNRTLSKTFHLSRNPTTSELQFESSEGTEIDWVDSAHPLTHRITKQKKKTPIREPIPSFFHFFGSVSGDDAEGEDAEKVMEGRRARAEEELALGESIKERLIPDALLMFTGDTMNESESEDEEESEEEIAPPVGM